MHTLCWEMRILYRAPLADAQGTHVLRKFSIKDELGPLGFVCAVKAGNFNSIYA
jgi:hypothetical protein